MSAITLLTGKLQKNPERRASSKGTDYAMATVRDGQGDAAVFWRVFAFSAETRDGLLLLKRGDGISISGNIRAEVYAAGDGPRVSLSIVADRLISARKAKSAKAAETRAGAKAERKAEQQPEPRASSRLPKHDGIEVPF